MAISINCIFTGEVVSRAESVILSSIPSRFRKSPFEISTNTSGKGRKDSYELVVKIIYKSLGQVGSTLQPLTDKEVEQITAELKGSNPANIAINWKAPKKTHAKAEQIFEWKCFVDRGVAQALADSIHRLSFPLELSAEDCSQAAKFLDRHPVEKFYADKMVILIHSWLTLEGLKASSLYRETDSIRRANFNPHFVMAFCIVKDRHFNDVENNISHAFQKAWGFSPLVKSTGRRMNPLASVSDPVEYVFGSAGHTPGLYYTALQFTDPFILKTLALLQRYNDRMSQLKQARLNDLMQAILLFMPEFRLLAEASLNEKKIKEELLPQIYVDENRVIVGISGVLYQRAFCQSFLTNVLKQKCPQECEGNLERYMIDNGGAKIQVDDRLSVFFKQLKDPKEQGTVAEIEMHRETADVLIGPTIGWNPSQVSSPLEKFQFEPILLPMPKEEQPTNTKPEEVPSREETAVSNGNVSSSVRDDLKQSAPPSSKKGASQSSFWEKAWSAISGICTKLIHAWTAFWHRIYR